MSAQDDEKLTIKVAAHVVIQLGQELVSDEEQALLELVKNAYDANSPDCEIILEPNWTPSPDDTRLKFLKFPDTGRPAQEALPGLELDQNGQFPPIKGRILIVDSGDGAEPTDIHKNWLTVSYSAKRPDANSKKIVEDGKRVPVGDKGLGRIATMKLGRILTFKSAIPDSESETITSFSWDDFLKVTSVDQVRVEETTHARSPSTRGSTVEIIGLHDPKKWSSDESLTRLIGKLSSLINPFEPIAQFSIKIRHKGRPHELHDIVKSALPFAPASFSFSWDGKELTYRCEILRGLFKGPNNKPHPLFGKIFSTEQDTQHFIDWIMAHKKYSKKLPISSASANPNKNLFSLCEIEAPPSLHHDKKYPGAINPGPFKGNFYYFLFNGDEVAKLETIKSSAKQIQNISGISMYRDGFKVRMADDWIGLSDAMTTGTWHNLRLKNTIGYFSISNEHNPLLVEKSDREGFVDSDAQRGLMVLTQKCRDWSNNNLSTLRTAFNEYTLSLNSPESTKTTKGAVNKISATRSHLTKELTSINEKVKLASNQFEELEASLNALSIDSDHRASISQVVDSAKMSLTGFEKHFRIIQDKTDAIGAASEEFKTLQEADEAKHLRLLEAASVGLSARILVHELRTYVDKIEDSSREIISISKNSNNPDVKLASLSLSSATRELRKIVATIDPLLPGTRSIKESFSASKEINNLLSSHAALANNFKIESSIYGADDFPCMVRFNRTRFQQIFENLFQNSIYWIQKASNNSGVGSVSVQFHASGFSWSDSGMALNPLSKRVFLMPLKLQNPLERVKG